MKRLTTILCGYCAILLSSCTLIDDDLKDCTSLNYELRLVTNMTTELRTELETEISTQTDLELSSALRQQLGDVFTDFAHDVDLSFYDTVGDSVLLQKDEHIMDANQASYALNLPMRQYMHLAAANVVDNSLVDVVSDDRCHRSMLLQTPSDTIDSHQTGLFTARQPMEVLGDVSQNFNVRLYMANCAATLVIDPRDHKNTDDIRVYSTGFATGFKMCDSVYMYTANPPVIRTSRVSVEDGAALGFTSVTFPSREPKAQDTRTIIETTEPFIAGLGEDALWEFHVYVRQPDGTVTETILRVKDPLRAGQFKIIKCWIGDDGEIVAVNPEVSTSVTLDWKEGLVINSEN